MREQGQVKSQKPVTFIQNGRRKFFFTMSFSQCLWLICQCAIAIPKKGNVERHFRTIHRTYDTDFPLKSELRKRKVRELKCQLSGQQSLLTQHSSKARTTTEASFRASHLLVKHKKSFQDGETVIHFCIRW